LTKSAWRDRQRNLSFAEKIAILEKMRRRDQLIATAGLRKARKLDIEQTARPTTDSTPS